jgi:hypothetical protein
MDQELETQTAQWAAIDQATLAPLVQSALNRRTVEVLDWGSEQLHGGAGFGTAIYRFSGGAYGEGQRVPWSLILKTLCPAEDNTNIPAWNYYKREADAYQSGWLDDLSGLSRGKPTRGAVAAPLRVGGRGHGWRKRSSCGIISTPQLAPGGSPDPQRAIAVY